MDFRELSYVMAIAKYQNITKAAESLYIGQPALSRFLKALEYEMGQPLFRKLGNKYVLTYAGERYVERANQILSIKSDMDEEMADIMKKDMGVLKVAIPTMRSTYMLPSTLIPFREMHPNVKVEIVEGHSSELDHKILTGEADVAFYTQSLNDINPLLDYEILSEEELLICAYHGHPLNKLAKSTAGGKYPHLDLAYLKDEFMIMMRKDQRTRQIVDSYLREANVQIKRALYTNNLPALIELVATGYGVSFIFEPHLRHRITTIPIDCFSFGEPRSTSNFVVAWRKGSYLPTYTRDYIDIVRQTQQIVRK